MKKILPILSLALVLFACKKSTPEEIKTDEKKYDVTFSVSDFNQSVVGFSTPAIKTYAVAGDTVKNYADNIYYRVYNSAGVMVNSVDQSSNIATFGTISDKLPSGTYNVFLAASKGVLFISSSSVTYSNAIYQIFSGAVWDDTFTKQIQLTVGTSAVNQSVKLDRTVGGLQLTLEDAIPSNAARISVIYQSENLYSYVNGNTPTSSTSVTHDFGLTTADVGVKNKTFLMYIQNTSSTSNVIIRAYDSSNGLIVEKTVTNVSCLKNKKTILTGSLFPATANPSVGFVISVNPIWDTPATPTHF